MKMKTVKKLEKNRWMHGEVLHFIDLKEKMELEFSKNVKRR
jgi:hypothetical protein